MAQDKKKCPRPQRIRKKKPDVEASGFLKIFT